jgi:hypothetical protein
LDGPDYHGMSRSVAHLSSAVGRGPLYALAGERGTGDYSYTLNREQFPGCVEVVPGDYLADALVAYNPAPEFECAEAFVVLMMGIMCAVLPTGASRWEIMQFWLWALFVWVEDYGWGDVRSARCAPIHSVLGRVCSLMAGHAEATVGLPDWALGFDVRMQSSPPKAWAPTRQRIALDCMGVQAASAEFYARQCGEGDQG